MNADDLKLILSKHAAWLHNNDDGECANLGGANLRGADLDGADLRGADLDLACWPLWCCSKNVKIDGRVAALLAAHFCAVDCDDPDYQTARAELLAFAKTSHRARALGLLEMEEQK